MFPRPFEVLGTRLAIWDAVFLLAVALGYVVLRATFRARSGKPVPRALLLRWIITVYTSVLGAQLFAYAFDLNTSLRPPASIGWARYYLNPLGGPKTLYGAIAVLPLSAVLVWLPWREVRYRELLDAWTPALMTVLAVARGGCLLQGCCYGRHSVWFGVRFPAGSPPYFAHLEQELITATMPSLPVVPTQAISAIILLLLAVWTWRLVTTERDNVFVLGVGAYSLFRFLIEFVRDDPERNLYGALSTSQWIAVIILALTGLWIRSPLRQGRRASAGAGHDSSRGTRSRHSQS